MNGSNYDLIKELLIDLSRKMEDHQVKTEAKLDNLEEKLTDKLQYFYDTTNIRFKDQEKHILECEHKLISHDGNFNTIKILFTSGVAGLLGVASWIFNLVHK